MTAIGDQRPTSLPDELSSSTAKLVYLSLSSDGFATVDRLRTDLGVSKLTLFSVLRELRETGLVEARDGGYATVR
ncbi:helix-turn-helix domain-containing protein [Halalkalicoccus subterraneus]|uniref:helix-turn-helix domain-containing protein n=1 Tax=Halalkalicoccus subterraneus TaxID=2675002 RepID=UPI000EFC4950|nr:helix-turn-helix domain-containing protein [Halalkalicoccus subterraneus]